jgi:hypothetical protein
MLACSDVRSARFQSTVERKPLRVLISNMKPTIYVTEAGLSMINDVSISMPTDIKNNPLKLSLKGRTAAVASCES